MTNRSGFGGWETRNIGMGVWYLRTLTFPSRAYMQDEEIVYFTSKAAAEKVRRQLEKGITELDIDKADLYRGQYSGPKRSKARKQPKFS